MIFRIVFLALMFRAIKVYGKILQDLNQQYSSLKFLRPLNIQDDNWRGSVIRFVWILQITSNGLIKNIAMENQLSRGSFPKLSLGDIQHLFIAQFQIAVFEFFFMTETILSWKYDSFLFFIYSVLFTQTVFYYLILSGS